jgi:hypothetical protein
MRPKIQHVPVERFNDYRWWEPQRFHKSPRWFYGFPAQNHHRVASSARLDTVDKQLRPLVALCQQNNIPTLPSCAGHFPPERALKALYLGIKRDSAWVRGHGLTLRCSESGTIKVYRNPTWSLPPYEKWAKPIRKANGSGRIGFVFSDTDPRVIPLIQSLRNIERVNVYATRRQRAIVVTLTTSARNPAERNMLWKRVFAVMRQAIRTI